MITKASESFDWQFATLGDAKLEKLLLAVKEYASAMQRKEAPHWFCLIGQSGVGKTHLAKRLAEFWNLFCGERWASPSVPKPWQAEPAKFTSWRAFMSAQRQGDFSGIQNVIRPAFTLLDDIGSEHDPNGFAKSRLDEVLDARLAKWTVITTNLKMDQLAAFDSRIASRMLRGGSRVLDLKDVQDFNLRRK